MVHYHAYIEAQLGCYNIYTVVFTLVRVLYRCVLNNPIELPYRCLRLCGFKLLNECDPNLNASMISCSVSRSHLSFSATTTFGYSLLLIVTAQLLVRGLPAAVRHFSTLRVAIQYWAAFHQFHTAS